MKRIIVGIALVLLVCACVDRSSSAPPPSAESGATPMTQERMEAILRSIASAAKGTPGMLDFTFQGVRLQCISDIQADRMRIIAAIGPVSALTGEQIARILDANFVTSLDARYGASQGILFAAFLHPLSPLTQGELVSAAGQVASLARTFGSTYSAGGFRYNEGEAL